MAVKNWRFPSCLSHLFQSEVYYKAIHVKIILVHANFGSFVKWIQVILIWKAFYTWPSFEAEATSNSEITDWNVVNHLHIDELQVLDWEIMCFQEYRSFPPHLLEVCTVYHTNPIKWSPTPLYIKGPDLLPRKTVRSRGTSLEIQGTYIPICVYLQYIYRRRSGLKSKLHSSAGSDAVEYASLADSKLVLPWGISSESFLAQRHTPVQYSETRSPQIRAFWNIFCWNWPQLCVFC